MIKKPKTTFGSLSGDFILAKRKEDNKSKKGTNIDPKPKKSFKKRLYWRGIGSV
jgi:hypothetical protein